MSGYYKPYPKGHPQPRVAAVIEVLETAWIAIETGQVLTASPGFKPTRKNWGRKEGREQLVSYLDSEFLHELTASINHWIPRGRIEHPQLNRLDDLGRVWLCEQLEAAVRIPWICMKDQSSDGITKCEEKATLECSFESCRIDLCEEHGKVHGHSINSQSDMGYIWTLTCQEVRE